MANLELFASVAEAVRTRDLCESWKRIKVEVANSCSSHNSSSPRTKERLNAIPRMASSLCMRARS